MVGRSLVGEGVGLTIDLLGMMIICLFACLDRWDRCSSSGMV